MDKFFTTLPAPAKAVLAFLSGAIAVLAMPPWGVWPALAAGLSLIYIMLGTAQSRRSAFAYGWLHGFGYFLLGLSWIGNALLVDGGDYAWAWPLAVAGLPFILAFYFGLAALLFFVMAKRDRFTGLLLFTALLCATEWLRGHLFTGFPWNLYGYTWSNALPVAQFASIGGVYLLTLLTIFWMTLPGFLLLSKDRAVIKIALGAAALLSLSGIWFYGHDRIERHPTGLSEAIAVRLVQPNIAQEDKWDPEKSQEGFEKLLSLSEGEPVNNHLTTLIVWPETATSDFMLEIPEVRAALKSAFASYGGPVYLATGYLRHEPQPDGDNAYFNSVTVFGRNALPLINYDKSHLVPFGEYIPFQKWIPLAPVAQFSGFVPGGGPRTLAIAGLGRLSLLVCYEIIFPGAVTEKDAPRPDWIINVTNDAWYGNTAGPRQHFAMARFRAIEEGLPVVRSANTGISGVFDPVGRIIYQTDMMEERASNVALPQKLHKQTLFSRYGHSAFFTIMLLLLVFPLFLQRCSKSQNHLD